MEIYVVKSNDSLYSIASFYKVTEYSIAYINQLPPPFRLVIGQSLLIPATRPPNIRKFISVTGFAYPYINEYTLSSTLPYLSELAVFSYGFTPDGDLIPPTADDTLMIAMANSGNTAPILTLAPLGADGRFNNHLIAEVVNKENVKANLMHQLITTIQKKGFKGVNIDFEYIIEEDSIAFIHFVADIRRAVNRIGFPVSVDLAPKISDNDPGRLSRGMDYGMLGMAANCVILMTYEWGYTYGPPMAVAPIHKVREVVKYAVSKIPPWKINLGIPNYGYDWTLPFVQGESKADTINNLEAIQIAVSNHAEIQYDEQAQSPFFHYWKDGIEHEVWFEDARSLNAKFNLVTEYDLMGIGYWQIMSLFRANWLLLSDTFWIRKND